MIQEFKKILLSKEDRIKKAKKNHPQLKLVYEKLKLIIPADLYKELYFDDVGKLCFGYNKTKVSLKWVDIEISRCYLIETKVRTESVKTPNEAICLFVQHIIRLCDGCHGFNFDIEFIDFKLVPQAKEKWHYKTNGAINFKDWLYNIIHHYDIGEWKSQLDLTKVKAGILIESMIMHKLYRIAQ